jgi:hypothetical protein
MASQCPRRDHIANVETELPQVTWRGPAPPEQFEKRLGPQSKAHGDFIRSFSPDA